MATFKSPPAHIGMPCLWYDGPDTNSSPYAAIVTATGNNVIDILAFPPMFAVGIPKNSVRHASDPAREIKENSESGCWDYTLRDQPCDSPEYTSLPVKSKK